MLCHTALVFNIVVRVDYQSPNTSTSNRYSCPFKKVRGDLIVTVPERMRLAASIGARGFVTGSDLGHPVRRVAAASVDVSIYRSIAVFAAYSRDLVVVPAGQSSSRYTTSDSVLAGLRLGLAFGSGDGKKSGNSAGDSGTPQGAKVEH